MFRHAAMPLIAATLMLAACLLADDYFPAPFAAADSADAHFDEMPSRTVA